MHNFLSIHRSAFHGTVKHEVPERSPSVSGVFHEYETRFDDYVPLGIGRDSFVVVVVPPTVFSAPHCIVARFIAGAGALAFFRRHGTLRGTL